jgi:hypothetical protein
MSRDHDTYEQKIAYARASLWAPFYTVGMTARIRGHVPTELAATAIRKLQILYPPLASRVRVEMDGAAWLTTEDVGECLLEVRSRTSDDDWAKIFLEQERVPFAFGSGPITRFFLLQGDQVSDLVAIAPHVICDGYSMTHVMWDAVALLNDPSRVVTPPKMPPTVTWKTVPHSAYDDLILRGLVRVVNRAWPNSQAIRHQNEYEELHRHYWARQQNDLLTFRLSPAETSDLVVRCRKRGVSVTGALLAAFLLAQADVRPTMRSNHDEISVSVNIRDRMAEPPGRVVGVYASSIDLKMSSKSNASFWELARDGHARIHKSLKDRPRILMPLVLDELNPSISDELVKAVSTDEWSPKLGLLTRFVKVKGDARCLNISNIGRIELPEVGIPYCLETLLPFPPLVPGGGMTLNVLTVNGHMNIILKFRQDEPGSADVKKIWDLALNYMSGA